MTMAHITTREYTDVTDWAAVGDHMDVQRMCITRPTPHWMQAAHAAQWSWLWWQRCG